MASITYIPDSLYSGLHWGKRVLSLIKLLILDAQIQFIIMVTIINILSTIQANEFSKFQKKVLSLVLTTIKIFTF